MKNCSVLTGGDRKERSMLWVAKILFLFLRNTGTDSSGANDDVQYYKECTIAIDEADEKLS